VQLRKGYVWEGPSNGSPVNPFVLRAVQLRNQRVITAVTFTLLGAGTKLRS